MNAAPLDRLRIQELYAAFQPTHPVWVKWMADYTAELERFQDIDLHERNVRTALWSARGLGTAGPSESISTEALADDPTFLEHLQTLVFRPLETMPSRRAQQLQALYDQMLAVAQDKLDRTPKVRLQRLMHALKPGDFACTWNQASLLSVRDLLVAERGLGVVENHVRIRARLRDALGKEADLAEHARRSVFCWWLYENADAIASGATPAPPTQDAEQPEPPSSQDIPETPSVDVWPLARQVRSMEVFRGGAETLCIVLRECLQPQTRELLVVNLEEDLQLAQRSSQYLTVLLRELRRLGFLQKQGEDYRTTNEGEAYLDDPQTDQLARALCARVRAFACLLTRLPAQSKDLQTFLEDNHFGNPSFAKSIRSRHLWWMQVSGVAARGADATWQLTELGESIVAHLPDVLPTPKPSPTDIDAEDAVEDADTDITSAEAPSFDAIWTRFQALASAEGLVFPRSQVRALFAAWRMGERTATPDRPAKRFALLSGLSGTGKTQLLLQYARAVCTEMGLDETRHVALVPVRPDWRDPTGLLGYLNALHAEPTFQIEPALALLLRATRNPGLPYFLLLDEMNLARVERYFAPFLSAMETGKAIDLHAHERPISGVPAAVAWPSALRIGGTVNMDESTHAFSDKVLDRAFTFEFWQVDLPAFFSARPSRTEHDHPVEDALSAFQSSLRPIRRHVGYRTAGEVLDWVAAARSPDDDLSDLIDQALLAKVLPRLRGTDSTALQTALTELHQLCEQRAYTQCAAKLHAMTQRLQDTGVTGFWA